ncbi:antifreeze protein [Ramaria rubella]|nr:antifreeze protein [Ramaria rubella]
MSTITIAIGPVPVNLASAGTFAILAKSGISSVPISTITGDIGVSPAAATSITGFSLVLSPDGTHASSSQVVGNVLAASYTSPTPSILTTAVSDMGTAYTNASGRVNPDHTNLANGSIGGLILTPGLYSFLTLVSIPSSVTLSGGPSDTWIIQIAGTLSMAANTQVILAGGALPENIFWAVAGSVTLGSNTLFNGILLGATAVTLSTGTSMNGQILSQTAVALQKAIVVKP